MFRVVLPIALGAALAACAADPTKTTADEPRCAPSDPPTGTLIARGARCVVTTEAERDAQRRAFEQMRQQQEMQRRPVGSGG